jgi:predicted ATP-grasp superfamily ATP-dependent carboligase
VTTGVIANRRGKRGALVLGSDYKALGIVRSLGRHGIPVWVLRDEHVIASWSRYSARAIDWPASGDAERVAFLLSLGARHGLDGWALFPTDDETAAFLARSRKELAARFTITTPRWEILRWAYDKRLTYRRAASIGVAHPRTHYPRSRAELGAIDIAFPAILKPAIRAEQNSFTMSKAWRVDDRDSLLARYDEAASLMDSSLIMVQELIPGAGEQQLSYAALCRDGRPIASVVARRTRQWPMDFGRASTFVETIDDLEVEASATSILETLRFTGIVEVEFKRDPRDGELKLLDINPRAWGWHSLGRGAGVDFPYLLWRMLSGETLPRIRGRAGVRWVRALTDLPTVLGEIRARRLSIGAYLRSLRRPIEYAILAADDPLPALVEVPAALALAWRRRTARPVERPVPAPLASGHGASR